jgi:catechol 2,3-dioxygenase-like lactoylglutathione lyase family enzyme
MTEQAKTPKKWPSGVAALTLFVEDLAAIEEFYDRAFGVPQAWKDDDSVAYNLNGTFVNFLRVQAAPELITPAKVAGPEAGTRAQYTIAVDDVDATCADLSERGVKLLNGPMDRPWGVRTATFADPAGHVWEIANLDS